MRFCLAAVAVIAVVVLPTVPWTPFSHAASRTETTLVPTPTPVTRPRTISSAGRSPDLGPGASLHGKQLFPPDNPWNQDISNAPVDPNSANLIAGMGPNDVLHPDFGTVWKGAPNGLPYVVVSGTQPMVPINFTAWGAESD